MATSYSQIIFIATLVNVAGIMAVSIPSISSRNIDDKLQKFQSTSQFKYAHIEGRSDKLNKIFTEAQKCLTGPLSDADGDTLGYSKHDHAGRKELFAVMKQFPLLRIGLRGVICAGRFAKFLNGYSPQ